MSAKKSQAAEKQGTQKRSILFTKDMLEQLEKLAILKHTTVSELVRAFVEQGLSVSSFTNDIDAISDVLCDRLCARLSPKFERLIALQVKAALAASMCFTLCAEALEKLVPPGLRRAFEESFNKAKKGAVTWMRLPERDTLESLRDEEKG